MELAGIRASIQLRPEETVIEKYFPNRFFQTELLLRLKEADVKNLAVCEAMSHMCIDTTVRAVKKPLIYIS